MIPLYEELVELYNEGELPQSEVVVFFDGEQRRRLGDEYATWCVWDQFLILMELDKKWRTILMNKLFNHD